MKLFPPIWIDRRPRFSFMAMVSSSSGVARKLDETTVEREMVLLHLDRV